MIEKRPRVELHCRTKYNSKNGKGGFGVVSKSGIIYDELSEVYVNTTNHRIKLLSIIEGLHYIHEPSRVKIYTDSSYVIESMKKGMVAGWEKNNWRRSGGKEVKNKDLWKTLLEYCSNHIVTFHKIKEQVFLTENVRCKALASEAIKSEKFRVDDRFLLDSAIDSFLANHDPDDGNFGVDIVHCKCCGNLKFNKVLYK